MTNRTMSVAGSFYPDSCKKIEEYITLFNSSKENQKANFKAKAIISPHAGYVFSGYTANCAYSLIDSKQFKRVVVVGPSHRVYLKGASIALYDNYDTPCNNIEIDLEYSKNLMKNHDFLSFLDKLHHEHSTETQMPFIAHYLPHAKVVEIVYSDISYKTLIPLFQELLDEPETLLVVSSDLSHFHRLKEANRIDNFCIEGIKDINIQQLESCEACGLIGIKALLSVAKESQVINYRTSYDASGDDVRVVGYLSALLQ